MVPLGEANLEVLAATAGILLLAVFADLIDGAIARAMKAESTFGGLFDSLADAITFGVGPSVIVLKTFSATPGTELSFILTTAAMVFSVCAVLRLVRFSVQSHHAREDLELLAAHNRNFTGLPVPAAAATAVSANLFLVSSELQYIYPLAENTRIFLMIGVLCLLGYFMISRWKFPSLKTLQVRITSFQLVFLTVLFAVIIFYGIMHHFPVVFFGFSWGYIVVAFSLSIIRKISGKKSKTLEDFEPEPEDEEWQE